MTTPADELAAAAETLKTARFAGAMTATPVVAALIRAREPIANWLQRHSGIAGEMQQYLGEEFQDGALDHDTHDALAVARAITGGQP